MLNRLKVSATSYEKSLVSIDNRVREDVDVNCFSADGINIDFNRKTQRWNRGFIIKEKIEGPT